MAAPGLEAGAADIAAIEGPRASQILGTAPSPTGGTTLGLLAELDAGTVSAVPGMEANAAWPMISRLSVTLAARIPMGGFRVRDLLALAAGQTIATAWAATEDVPLLAGDLQVGWSEFEVVGRKMALRLTRLV